MPMSKPPEDPPPKDRLTLHDVERFHTKALDLGAVRAIDRAGQPAANDFAAGNPPPSVHRLKMSERRAQAAEEPIAADLAVTEQTAATERTEASPWEVAPSSAPIDRDALPSAQLSRSAPPSHAPNAKTIEIDYSPASRVHRARSAKVQHAARLVTVACAAAALALAVWAIARSNRETPPLALHAMPALSAPTSLATVAIEPASTTNLPPSTTTDAKNSSTVPTVAVATTAPAPRTPPQPPGTAVSGGAAVSAAPAVSTATPEARPTAAPSTRPSATTPPPGGTVDLPIPE